MSFSDPDVFGVLEAGCSLADAPPRIGRQSLHTRKARVAAFWNICCIGAPFITTDLLILTTQTNAAESVVVC